MDRDFIKDKVISLIQEILCTEDVNESDGLMDDLDLCSLDILDLENSIEEDFNVVLGEKEMRAVTTVADLIDVVYSKV